MRLSWFIIARFIHIMYTIYLREKANVRDVKILKLFVYFLYQNLFLQISRLSNVQILKILTVWTLKNSQSSVTLNNECMQLRYYFKIKLQIVYIWIRTF